MKLILFFLLIIATFFLPSCDNEVDINSEWEDITIVYGLLDQSEQYQYIKITKAFLGNNSAYDMANEFDSLYYKEGEISAYIEEYTGNDLISSTELVRVDTVGKADGIFHSPTQILYVTDKTLSSNYSYKIKIINNKTSKIIYAKTNLIIGEGLGKTRILRPYSTSTDKINWVSHNINADPGENIRWANGINAKTTQLIARIHYTEILNNDSTEKYIEIKYSTKKIDDITNQKEFNEYLIGSFIYKSIASAINVTNVNVTRKIGNIDFLIYESGEELYNYQELNKPSSGLTQYKPTYTNINNGIGLFSSRYKIVMLNKQIHEDSKYEIANSPLLANYNFFY